MLTTEYLQWKFIWHLIRESYIPLYLIALPQDCVVLHPVEEIKRNCEQTD